MKRLIVFRHAKSSWDDESLDDHDRPLAPRGERDAPEMARYIVEHAGLRRGVLLTSTARRAVQTAAPLAAAAGADLEVVTDGRLYLAPPGAILTVVGEQQTPEDTIVLVGHNPGLTQLVNLLLPNLELHELPTAGVVVMDLPIESWSGIGTRAGKLVHRGFPRELKSA